MGQEGTSKSQRGHSEAKEKEWLTKRNVNLVLGLIMGAICFGIAFSNGLGEAGLMANLIVASLAGFIGFAVIFWITPKIIADCHR